MAQRNCYFKDCHSRGDSSGRTFFNFPFRDPERLFRWLAVTGCTKLELERKPRYVCDLHFNKKFFATCQRRKVLVGQAIPDLHRVESSLSDEPSAADTTGHPMADENDDVKKSNYDENNDDEVEYVDDNELFLNENDGLEYREDQTASTGEEESGFPPAEKEAINSRGAKSVTVLNGKMLKGQVVFTPINEKRSSSPLSRTNPPKRPKLEEQEQTDRPANPELSPNAKIISIKGVQYVQMAKHVYLAEQQMARDEIAYWKNLVMGLKQQLDDVEF